MNYKVKVLAAAVAVALAGSASAAPLTPNSLYLTAFDSSNVRSLLINLGVTTTTFIANPSAFSFDLATSDADSATALAAWIAASTDIAQIKWNINGVVNAGSGLATSEDLDTFPTTGGSWGGAGEIGGYTSNFAGFRPIANVNLVASNVWTNAGADAFNPTSASALGFDDLALVNGSMPIFQFYADPSDEFAGAYTAFRPDTEWLLSYVSGVANLEYGDDVAPIPLPAAAWLLLSGLAGLAGVARRRAA